ncbi:MAG: hypothetical protein LKK08_06130 [Bacteroidales bacterium]|jgi:hypothetical protein|nr:hypothetical protein [Bacteroidales bacterium]
MKQEEENFEDDKKIVVNLPQGTTKAEVVIRKGEAPDEIEPKPPIPLDLEGMLGTTLEFITKRISEKDQINQKRCNIYVDREEISITLITNEDDEYKMGKVKGTLKTSAIYELFGINDKDTKWAPADLGMFMKMHRSFFPNKTENMSLVTTLMHFTATVNNTIERSMKENGDHTDNFAQVVNSNLPKSFHLKLPIFVGLPAEDIEVETFAQINGREVIFYLLSPAANDIIEDARTSVIDDQLDKIKAIAPDIVIYEV